MKSHSDIIRAVGAEEIAKVAGVSIYTARSWVQRDSIPAPHWASLIDAGHATAEDLVRAADARAA